MSSAEFSTFCHISQYGEEGYRALPHIVSMSQACLWSPSSVMLKNVSSGLSTSAFLDYLDAGYIRIFGRSHWIHDSHWRKTRDWEEAAWDPAIDGVIRSWCEEDSGKPAREQRVAIAPVEEGNQLASDYLSAHPEEIPRWTGVLKRRPLTIPSETRENALRHLENKDTAAAVHRILRDAYNHGQAIAFSGADAPVFVEDLHREFFKKLSEAPPLDGDLIEETTEQAQRNPDGMASGLHLSGVADAQMRLLNGLDVVARNHGNVDSLDRFIRGQGRQDLMSWMQRVCQALKYQKPSEVDGALIERLREDLGDDISRSRMQSLLANADDVVSAVGLVSAAAGMAGYPTGAFQVAGVVAGGVPVGKALVRYAMGAPHTFTGPRWPFLYVYGTKPRKKQRDELKYKLEILQRLQQPPSRRK